MRSASRHPAQIDGTSNLRPRRQVFESPGHLLGVNARSDVTRSSAALNVALSHLVRP